MTTPSDYSVWLVAQRLKELILAAGGSVSAIEMRFGHQSGTLSNGEPFFTASNLGIHISRGSDSPERREEIVAALLATIPGAQLKRKDGQMTVWGAWSTGVTYYLWGGEGVCERVQTGTRKVLRPDPEAPLIEVEEPVFETRCVDPLAEMEKAS